MSKPRDPAGNDWIVACTALAIMAGKDQNRSTDDVKRLSYDLYAVVNRWLASHEKNINSTEPSNPLSSNMPHQSSGV